MPVLATAEEKTTVDKVGRSNRLARFVAVLPLDSGRLQDFIADPETEMTAAGLTPEEKDLLRDESFRNLCDYFWKVGDKPTPPDEPPDDLPSGSSG